MVFLFRRQLAECFYRPRITEVERNFGLIRGYRPAFTDVTCICRKGGMLFAATDTLFMKKLILFDLDGTLLDTLEDLSEAVNHALELRGLPLHTTDEYRHMVGHGVRNLVQQALPSNANETLTDSALGDFRTYYQAHIDVHTRPYPGMPELLADLHSRGIMLAVASNKFQEGTEYLVQRLFPGIPFVAILGNRPGWPLKPDPDIVQEVLKQAAAATGRKDFAPEDAIMVGDSPTDMRTAANGGIDALAVTWGYRSAEELEPVLRELFPDGRARMVSSVPALRIELLGRDIRLI